MKIRQGDTVQVIAGKEKGRKGKVERVLSPQGRVLIEGINLVTRHIKPRPEMRQAGRVQKESPIHISNVMVICSSCTKPVRVKSGRLEDGRKVRVCQRCRETIA